MKHFIKTLVLFVFIIAFALLAIFVISYISQEDNNIDNIEGNAENNNIIAN